MAYTDPRTWVTGEIVTAAQLNEQLRDNMLAMEAAACELVFDGSGAAIVVGTFLDVRIPFKCDIVSADAYGGDTDVSHTIEVDIRKILASDFATPPASSDSICAAARITIPNNATFVEYATLAGWAKGLVKGNLLRYFVTACTGLTKVTVVTNVERS